jgi:thioredoxin reductase
VRNEKTGILGNGEYGYELAKLISNWTPDLTLFTSGPSKLTAEQTEKLLKHQIHIVEKEIERLEHINGHIEHILFTDGTKTSVKAIYVRASFEQHCKIPETLGCELTYEGYIKVSPFGETTVDGIFACGDNATRMRTVANAISMGTTAGITVSKKLIFEVF